MRMERCCCMESSRQQEQTKKNKYLRLLSEKYPTKQSVYAKLIHLQAMQSLPKGIEHFMSDLHGEYELFFHILNNCSGVIREKVDYVFGARLTDEEKADFCTLIYYPKEKIERMRIERKNTPEWYRVNLSRLLEVAKLMSYKYPSAKVRSFLPKSYESVIIELLNTHPEADKAQFIYHKRLLNMIVQIDSAPDFIRALTVLIKRLAVDHLHIVGDFFDRGKRPDAILDMLMQHHSLDIQWGNHDVLWMGAACGSDVCIAGVVRNSLRYNNTDVLEKGYAISLRPLSLFAARMYPDENPLKASERAISMIMFKLEGQLIQRNPDFHMENRLLLDKIDFEKGTVRIGDKEYEMLDSDFPTVDPKDPYRLTAEEEQVVERLRHAFVHCEKLQKHVRFLFAKGSMYKIFNSNLLYHGCVPMDEDGNFEQINVYGKLCSGKKLYEVLETYARKGYYSQDKEERRKGRDTLWYIWAGPKSPVFGKDKMATFERYFIADKETHKETKNAYYRLYDNEEILNKILREFGLDEHRSHIINGHVPVEIKRGETPIKCNGKLLIIDGGFSKAYQGKTGIAGYTLVANSHGMNLVEHRPFVSAEDAIRNETDMVSDNILIETAKRRILVADTDIGRELKESIGHLEKLLNAYRDGILIEKGI